MTDRERVIRYGPGLKAGTILIISTGPDPDSFRRYERRENSPSALRLYRAAFEAQLGDAWESWPQYTSCGIMLRKECET